jgi:hypothetical protein
LGAAGNQSELPGIVLELPLGLVTTRFAQPQLPLLNHWAVIVFPIHPQVLPPLLKYQTMLTQAPVHILCPGMPWPQVPAKNSSDVLL